MINHARTLLLNRAASYFVGVPGSEYIPPTYVPIELPTAFQKLRNIFFPVGIDKSAENYISAKLLQILHAPELLPITLYYDPRFTYSVDENTLSQLIQSPLRISGSQSPACDMVARYKLLSHPDPVTIASTGTHVWTFSTGDDNNATFKYSRSTDSAETILLTNGTTTSERVDLLNGFAQAFFDLPSLLLTGKYNFQYELFVPPPYDLAAATEAAQLYVVQPTGVTGIFRSAPAVEDVLEKARFVWQNAAEVTLKLGAILSAYIAQLEALRRIGGAE
jgi:hypothetical protein